MDLKSFEEKLLPPAFGFRNMGVTCYFNSLMQSLLSCTSLTEVMLKNRNLDEYKNNPVATKYISILDQIFSGAEAHVIEQLSPAMWITIIQYLKNHKSHSYFGNGQEDSHESFKMLMECWEDLDEVIELFTHKDHISIYCTSCSQWNNSQSEDISNNNISNEILLYYELARGLKSEIPLSLERIVKASDREHGTIEGFLSRQITYMEKGYRCQCFKKELYYFDYNGNRRLKDFPCACRCSDEKKSRAKDCKCEDDELKKNNGRCADLCDCKCKCNSQKCQYRCHSDLPKLKVVSMRLIPEILVIMCPAKVHGKYNEEFPENLRFKTKYGEIKYRAISQIIHSGGASGGHYWANSIRMTANGPQWFELNDSGFNRVGGFKANEGTYVVIYHKQK
jgi:ubiquitin C-terminal hydrolase